MKSLRFDNDEAMRMQKRFGAVWEEYGTNVYQLIAEAHDENWDAEDEQKHAPALAKVEYAAAPLWEKKESTVNQRNDDNLAPAREAGTRERLDQLQGKPEASLCVVEEEQGKSAVLRSGKSAAEEATPAEESGRRRGSFYRLAGGTG